MKLYYDVFPTDFGWYAAAVSDRGLRYSSMRSSPQEAVESLTPQIKEAVFDQGPVRDPPGRKPCRTKCAAGRPYPS